MPKAKPTGDEPMPDLYEAIGAKRGDSDADIKAAYRKAARKAHPDAGGSPEDFKAIGFAGMILCDPVKRDHYDRTGEEPNSRNEVERRLARLIGRAFDQDTRDPIKAMCEFIEAEQSEHKMAVRRFNQEIKKTKIRRKKFLEANKATKNVEAREFIADNLQGHIDNMTRSVESAKAEVKLLGEMLEYLQDLKCPPSPDAPSPFMQPMAVNFRFTP